MRREALVLLSAAALFLHLDTPRAIALPSDVGIEASGAHPFQYVSPLPGSQRVSRWNNIAIRFGGAIDPATVESGALTVTGATSGIHTGRRALSDDEATLIFRPDHPFAPGERVTVRLDPGVRTRKGAPLPALAFDFRVATADPREHRARPLGERLGLHAFDASQATPPAPRTTGEAESCMPFPTAYPPPVVMTADAEPGSVFLAPFAINSGDGHLMILGTDGLPVFYRYLGNVNGAVDFKRQPNGLLTYFQGDPSRFYALDSSYTVVDSFETGNGYPLDLHELQILPNGHALLMSYDPQPVDMSVVVPGGDPDAIVIGLVIQELDTQKNVVFQWRSWDHFEITDGSVSPLSDLTGPSVDYVHANALELDHDGHVLLCSRHLNEITKIDRQTGAVLWRMGAHALHNEFTFVGDPRGFSHPHDIRRLANGHLTLYDNGNFLDPLFSRALEYDVDETNKIATLVWEHRNSPDVYAGFMGSAQRLEDGGTVIGWGGTFGNPKVTQVRSDGSKALEMGFQSGGLMMSYRAFRFPWRTNRFATDVESLDFGEVQAGVTVGLPLTVRNTSPADVTINCYAATDPSFEVSNASATTLGPGETVTVQVTFHSDTPGEYRGFLDVRQMSATEIVAQRVAVHGVATGQTGVDDGVLAGVRFDGGRPNPFRSSTDVGFTLSRPGHVRVEILDVHGRLVATLADGMMPGGRQDLRWTAGEAPNGIYFARLRTADVTLLRKLVRMR